MQNRLLLSYSIVVLVSSIVGCLIASILVRNAVVDLMLEVQRKEAEPFQSYFQNYYIEHEGWAGIEAQEVTALVKELAPQELKHYELALINTKGVFILAENPANMGREVSRATLEIAAPILVNEETVGYLLSGNFIDRILTSVGSEVFHRALIALIKALTLGLLSGFLMSVFMTRALMRPIGTTIAAAKRISQGNLSLRVPLEPYGDMAELGRAVNEMAADLEKHQDNQRYMLMDIAHDLRTPLSVQKATIEAFEDGIYEFNEAGIHQLKQQNNQLIRLVEDLRIITLTDLGEFTPEMVPVEINCFLEKILQDFRNFFAKKSIGFNYVRTDNDCMVLFDPHLMTRVIENLLQNAYQHSPENSMVDVHIRPLINRVVIRIRDQGPGIPEEKLETIFQRYYRVRRNDETSPEGLGLGLTISKRIVESHDGRLYAHNSQDGGAEFVIELPCSGSED
jgi:signal transduction histidine kinase